MCLNLLDYVGGTGLTRLKLNELIKSQDWTMFGIIASIFLIWRIGTVGNWSTECWILLCICLLGVRKDQIDVDWKRFFLFGIPLLGVFYYFYGTGNGFWWKIANWMFENNRHPWRWDSYMNAIPLNSGDGQGGSQRHFWIEQWCGCTTMALCFRYGFVLFAASGHVVSKKCCLTRFLGICCNFRLFYLFII